MDPNPTIDPIASFHPGTSGKQVTILRRLPYHFPYFIGVVHPITLFLHVQLRKNLFLLFFTPTVAPSFLTVNRWNDHPFFFSDHQVPHFFLRDHFPSTWAGSLVISDDFDCLEPWELPSPQHSGFHRSVTLPARMEVEPGVPVVRWICPFWGGGFGGSTPLRIAWRARMKDDLF